MIEDFQEIYFRILNFLVGEAVDCEILENLDFNSKFPQLFEKDSGRRAWPGASEKGEGRERVFWKFIFRF